jgi:hypothetical protein
MEKIELTTPEPDKVLPVLRDAIDRQKRILLESLTKTEENIRQLATRLGVDQDLLLAGNVPHPEEEDLDLLELEGELEISRHLREQLESLEHLTICR